MAPTTVLIHGGWHYPIHYQIYTSALQSLGFEVFVPPFVSSLVDTDREVVVVMHSYSRQVGTNGLDRLDRQTRETQNLPGSVVRLIYICAQALPLGESMHGIVVAAGREENFLVAMDINDGTTMVWNAAESLLGRDAGLLEEDVQAYVGALGVWNWAVDIPVTYSKTLRDMALPVSYQSRMVDAIRAAGVEVEAVELDSGHSPHVTMPDELAGIVHGVVLAALE
ncbi:alpha/beta-hydrolase [Aspergillus karnatakaensis]|uniref:alpha/beta-hydrolase n=1 Tax=Aspergillus karnatakaensis TaxID=1810916 RepID=UPI003CCDEBDB